MIRVFNLLGVGMFVAFVALLVVTTGSLMLEVLTDVDIMREYTQPFFRRLLGL